MDRLKISTRLTFSFMTLMVLILVLGGVALWGSSTQRSALTDITQKQIPIVAKVSESPPKPLMATKSPVLRRPVAIAGTQQATNKNGDDWETF
ncbi:Tar ligand binding domain-containing protein [Comamonas thiooxydans]|uniref:Tar ligand binding domain-containing protein n=1 Tax=Comamonas thiooxydans TaxID=363952 RepID=UPI00265F8791|nr:Tar ligand binding domain-containing protein [Comamonas thiooxydans]